MGLLQRLIKAVIDELPEPLQKQMTEENGRASLEEDKGKDGEKQVAERLSIITGHKHILNDIMLNDNGKTRQIDHIAITEYGVYVIETKNYTGSIYGQENSNEWKKYIHNNCYTFKNPIHQNYGHWKVVKECIEDITDKVYPIITFIRKCKLNINTTTPVIYEDQLSLYIKSQKKVLSAEQIDKIYKELMENVITDEERIRDHAENVQHYIQYKEELISSNICPRCNGELTKKYGKRGSFLGCSNYPKCRYTKNLTNN